MEDCVYFTHTHHFVVNEEYGDNGTIGWPHFGVDQEATRRGASCQWWCRSSLGAWTAGVWEFTRGILDYLTLTSHLYPITLNSTYA